MRIVVISPGARVALRAAGNRSCAQQDLRPCGHPWREAADARRPPRRRAHRARPRGGTGRAARRLPRNALRVASARARQRHRIRFVAMRGAKRVTQVPVGCPRSDPSWIGCLPAGRSYGGCALELPCCNAQIVRYNDIDISHRHKDNNSARCSSLRDDVKPVASPDRRRALYASRRGTGS
jgi:hypothetical protein